MSLLLAIGVVSAPFAAPAAAAEPPPASEGWTRSSHWKRQPDGRVRVEAYAAPAFARRGNGWAKVDARLTDTYDARAPFAAPNALMPLRIGNAAGRLLELDLPRGPVRLSAPALNIGTPEREGNVVTFRDVATDTDLKIEVTAHGMRTQFVLRSAAAPTSFQLRLDDPSDQLGDVRETDGGGFEFTKKIDGDLLMKASPGFAYEEADAAGGAPVGVAPGTAHLAITKDGSGFVLNKRVDSGWLQGKTFPVVLDPMVWLEGTDVTTDCHIVSGTRIDTNYCPSTTMEIGYHSDTLIRRALLKFSLPGMPEGATVDSNSANLYLVTNVVPTATTTAPTYDAYEVSAQWTTNTTWRRRTATVNWTTAGGTWFSGARGSVVMERVVGSASVMPINTAMIQKWATNTPTNNGIIVRARSESTQTMLRIGASDHADQPEWPLLTYDYTEAPGAPKNVAAVPDRARALVSWSPPDTTTDPIQAYRVKAVCQSSGCTPETQVFECSASCRSQWVDVAGGHYYTFEVRARDVAGRVGPAGVSLSTFVRSNTAPITPDQLLPPNDSKLRSTPSECGRYYDQDDDPGTLVVDVRRNDGTPVATNVGTTLLTSNTSGCVAPSLGDGHYEWDAVATDGVLTSGRTAVQRFLVDGTPPVAPTLTSTTHPDQNGWYATSAATVAIAATDLSGIKGHSYVLDTSSGTVPDESLDLYSSSLSLTVPDGDRYLHVRSCNGTDLCSLASAYRLRVDTVKPNMPVLTASHGTNAWSNDNTVNVSWPTPYDATSGVLGYRTLFSQTATDVPTSTNTFANSTTSQTLANGDWWFHIRAVDRANNLGDVVHLGPFKIDVTLPGAPVLSSSTHDQTNWSPNNQVRFTWSATDTSGITGYSWSLDDSATGVPDTTIDTALSEVTLTAPDALKYFHVRALDGAGNWSSATTFTLRVDATAPVLSTLSSSTHPSETAWYGSSATPTFSWAASDVSGITGFSYTLDQSPTTVPDTVSEGTATSRSYTTPLADGVWYFHVRAINGAGLIGATIHRKLMVDVTAPATPILSSTHSSTAWSANRDVTFTWSQAPDTSGVVGYAVVFNQSPTTVPAVSATTTSTSQTFTNVADGTWYAHVRSINGSLLGSTTATYKVMVDGTAAALTSLGSSTHPDNTKWYAADDVAVSFAAVDLSGIVGYSYLVDQLPQGTPDAVVDVTTTSTTISNLSDGVWYVHVRAVNGAGLAGPVTSIKVLVDDTVPTTTSVTSPDHPVNMTTNQRVVNLDWSAAPGTDAMSGIAGYDVVFTTNATPITSAVTSPTTTSTSFTSASLADGTWYAHVRVVDKALNTSTDAVYGPIHIDPTAPPVSDAERDRFIALWKPRVTSETFGKPYLDSPGYPPSILAEGFHGYNPIQKAYLVDKLWAQLMLEYPLPADVQATEQAARDEVYDFVYLKDRFLLPNTSTELIDTVLHTIQPELPILHPTLAALDLTRGVSVDLPSLNVPELPDLGLEEVVTDVESTLEPALEDVTATLSAETNAALEYLQNQLHDTLDDVAAEVAAVAAGTVPIDTAAVFKAVNILPVEAGYTVCFETASRSGCQNVAVVGVPALVDLTGDLTPDVIATFGPHIDTDALGVGFQLDIQRAPTPNDMAGEPLRAHVWATYDVPLYNTRIDVGFNGLADGGRLSEQTVLDLTITDPMRLQQRDFLTSYRLDHTGTYADPWALTMGIRNITGDVDSTKAKVRYKPPSDATGTMNLVNDDVNDPDDSSNPSNKRDRTVYFSSKTSEIPEVKITAHQVVDARDEETYVTLLAPKFQRDTTLTLHDVVPANGDNRDVTVEMTSDQRMPSLSANVDIRRAARRIRFLGTLTDVPTWVKYHMHSENGSGKHAYRANGSLGSLAAAGEFLDGSVRKGTATVRATSVPATLDLTHAPDPAKADKILVDYSAAGVVPSLTATGYYRPEQLALKLAATNVPVLLSGEADTALRHVAFDAPTAIPTLDVTLTRKTTKVSRLPGEHVTLITPATGTFGLSAKVNNLKSATFDLGTVLVADATFAPGGQKMSVGGQIGAAYFNGEVSNVPSTLHLTIDRVNLELYYRGSSVVPKLRAYGGLRPGGPHVEATLTNVPTDMRLTVKPLGSSGALTYQANAPLGTIERFVATSDGTVGDKSGTTVQGRITGLPNTATITADRGLRKFALSANQAIGDVDVTMSRNGAQAQRAASNHLTFKGTTSAWAVGVRLGNVKSADLDMSQGLTKSSAHLTLSTAGQAFVMNGNLDGIRAYAHVSNLPAQFGYDANGTENITYSTSTPIDKLVVYVAKTGTGPTLRGQITGTPLTGAVSATIAKPSYEIAFSAPTAFTGASGFYSSRYVDVTNTATTDFVSGSVKGLPTWFKAKVNTATKQVTFQSDKGLDEVKAQAKGLFMDGLQAEALLRNVPAEAHVHYDINDILFDGRGGTIGYAFARGSNYTSPPKRMAGKHVYLRADLTNGRFSTSAELTNVSVAKVLRSGTTLEIQGNVDIGATTTLGLDLQADFYGTGTTSGPAVRVSARGTVVGFPSELSINRTGDTVTYAANRNVNANLTVTAGYPTAINNAPAPQVRNGVSVTDGACGPTTGCPLLRSDNTTPRLFCQVDKNQCLGFKGRIHYDGLPTQVILRMDAHHDVFVSTSAIQSPSAKLSARADLRHFTPWPLTIDATIEGVIPGTTIDLGPVRLGKMDTGGAHVFADLRANRDLGKLTLKVNAGAVLDFQNYRYSDFEVDATFDKVPWDMEATFEIGHTSRLRLRTSSAIPGTPSSPAVHVDVSAKVFNFRGGGYVTIDPDAHAMLDLWGIPASPTVPMDLSIGIPAPTGTSGSIIVPNLSYTAAESTLDAAINIDPSWGHLLFFDGVVTTQLQEARVAFTDLSKTFNAMLDPSTWQVEINTGTAPATPRFTVEVKGLAADVDFSGSITRRVVGLRTIGSLDLDAHLSAGSANVELTNVKYILIKPGRFKLAYGVSGEYGTFRIWLNGIDFDLEFDAKLRVRPKPDWSWVPDLLVTELYVKIQDVGHFLSHVNDADSYGTLGECFRAKWGFTAASASLQVRPAPQKTHEKNGITLVGAEGDKVVSVLDPGWGNALTVLLDAYIAMIEDPFDNGDWRIKTAMGDGAC